MFRNSSRMAALMPLFAASLALSQSHNEVRSVTPGQPGELRVFITPDGQVVEGLPQGGSDARFWSARPPGAALSIGIYVSSVQPVMASQLRLRKGTGLVVDNVAPGTAAEQAGIQRYDIIERINNRTVANVGQIEQMLRGNKSGDRVPFLIIRQGERQNIDVTVEAPQGQQGQRTPEKPFEFSPKDYLPNRFQFTPDQTRELQQMSDQLKKEVEQQERQIERLKENLRRQADQARRELEQLKDQIRRELEQQKKQMLDQLKTKPDSDKLDSGKSDSDKQEGEAQPKRY